MDGNKIGKNVITALVVVLSVIGLVGALAIAPFITSIIVGAITDVGSTSGVITADSAIDNFTDTIVTNFTSNMGKVTSATGIALNLLVLAIVLIVLGGLIYMGYKKVKGGSGGNMGV